MINVFDINDNLVTNTHNINGSSVYFIDNFYKNPDELVKLLKNTKCGLHKSEEKPSFNGVYFEDKRHKFKHDGMNKVSKTISEIIGQPILHDTNQVMTNISTYKSTEFNDYKNNYWWPHLDEGYNAIIYLNEEDTTGTNLYKTPERDELYFSDTGYPTEHYVPWQSKDNWELVLTINSKYNRLVIFDGYEYYHGASITDETYFDGNYRMNQVVFLKR